MSTEAVSYTHLDVYKRQHDTRADLGFNIFTWDQTEETKKRVYPTDHIATGAYVILEDGTEAYLKNPKYVRMEKIIIVVEDLEKTVKALSLIHI